MLFALRIVNGSTHLVKWTTSIMKIGTICVILSHALCGSSETILRARTSQIVLFVFEFVE